MTKKKQRKTIFLNFRGSSNTRSGARNRAVVVKKWLQKNAGGIWKITVWENMGFYYSLQQGTISISNDGHLLLNRGDSEHIGVGHGSFTSYHPDDKKQLLKAIKESVREHRKWVIEATKSYSINYRILGYKKVNF